MNDTVRTGIGQFAIVPLWLTEAASPQALKLFALMAGKWADRTDQDCHPSRRTLAEMMGWTRPQSVDQYLDELVKLGAMRVEARFDEHGDRTSNVYTLFFERRTARGGADLDTTLGYQPDTHPLYVDPHSNQNQLDQNQLDHTPPPPPPAGAREAKPADDGAILERYGAATRSRPTRVEDEMLLAVAEDYGGPNLLWAIDRMAEEAAERPGVKYLRRTLETAAREGRLPEPDQRPEGPSPPPRYAQPELVSGRRLNRPKPPNGNGSHALDLDAARRELGGRP